MDEYQKSNREQKLAPVSKRAHWCNTCDRHRVNVSERCPVCNVKAGKRTLKDGR